MDFGAGTFKWTPQSYPFESAHLSLSATKAFHVGLPQWAVKDWKGSIYPKDCKPQEYLERYSSILSCVEVSSTFYSKVADETLRSWRDKVPSDFKFLPKWPKQITHDKKLRVTKTEIQDFLSSMENLGSNLGTSLLQLPPHFSTEFRKELFHVLCEIPSDFPIAIEFRHPSWFLNGRVYDKLESYLISKNIGMICSDTPSRRDLFHLSFTSSHSVIRYLSDNDVTTDRKRIGIWKKWISSLEGAGNFYFVLHKPDNSLTPQLLPIISHDYQKKMDLVKGPTQDTLF